MFKQHQILEAEFRRIAETKTFSSIFFKESVDEPNRFHLMAVDEGNKIIYSVRHARKQDLRTWRLDVLLSVFKSLELGLASIEIILAPQGAK